MQYHQKNKNCKTNCRNKQIKDEVVALNKTRIDHYDIFSKTINRRLILTQSSMFAAVLNSITDFRKLSYCFSIELNLTFKCQDEPRVDIVLKR